MDDERAVFFHKEIARIEQLMRGGEFGPDRALARLIVLLAVSNGQTISSENAEAFKRMRDTMLERWPSLFRD